MSQPKEESQSQSPVQAQLEELIQPEGQPAPDVDAITLYEELLYGEQLFDYENDHLSNDVENRSSEDIAVVPEETKDPPEEVKELPEVVSSTPLPAPPTDLVTEPVGSLRWQLDPTFPRFTIGEILAQLGRDAYFEKYHPQEYYSYWSEEDMPKLKDPSVQEHPSSDAVIPPSDGFQPQFEGSLQVASNYHQVKEVGGPSFVADGASQPAIEQPDDQIPVVLETVHGAGSDEYEHECFIFHSGVDPEHLEDVIQALKAMLRERGFALRVPDE